MCQHLAHSPFDCLTCFAEWNKQQHCLGRGKDWHRLAMAKSVPGHNFLVNFSSKKDERGVSWTAFLCQVLVRLPPWWRAWSGGTGQTLHIQVVLAQPLLDQIALHLRWTVELGTEKLFLHTKLLNEEVAVKLTARLCSRCGDTRASKYFYLVEKTWKLLSALHWPLHTHCAFPTPTGCQRWQIINIMCVYIYIFFFQAAERSRA